MPSVQQVQTFNAPYDQAWAAVIETVAEMSLPIESIEKESGLLTTRFVRVPTFKQIQAVAYLPSVFLGTWSNGRYTLSLYVSRVGEQQTAVRITPHIEAYEDNATHTWHVCESNGSLERQVLQKVHSKLEG